MRVARRSGLEGESADLGAQDFLDDIRKGHVGNVRAVPGAPADMQARLFLGQAGDGIIEHIDALANETTEVLHGRLGIDLVPSLGQVGRVELHSKPSIGDGLVLGAHGAADVGKQLMLIVVVAVGQARCRAGRKGGDEAGGAGREGVGKQAHIGGDLVLADVGHRAGELWVRHLGAAGENARIRVIIGLREQRAVAAINKRRQPRLTRLGAHHLGRFPAVGIRHRQPAQAAKRIIPPRAIIHRARGDMAILALVNDIEAEIELPLDDVRHRSLQNPLKLRGRQLPALQVGFQQFRGARQRADVGGANLVHH